MFSGTPPKFEILKKQVSPHFTNKKRQILCETKASITFVWKFWKNIIRSDLKGAPFKVITETFDSTKNVKSRPTFYEIHFYQVKLFTNLLTFYLKDYLL